MTFAQQYSKAVLSGEIKAGKWIVKACERFERDLLNPEFFWDNEAAERVVKFFEKNLHHWEGSWRGKELKLELWQKFILQQTFGWKMASTGRKRVRSVYVQIARKNGKTSFAAGITLYHLFADKENTPQVLVGANNEDQAKICVNSAGRIIENSPKLNSRVLSKSVDLFQYKDNIINIVDRKANGVIKAMSRDPRTKDGFNPSMGVIDEYHEAKDDKLLNVLESGQGARPEPLLFCITTAGFDKSGPCYSKLRKASTEILDGISNDESHLAFIYELDDNDNWEDPENWIKSNPNLNVSIFPEYLMARVKKAKIEGGSKEVDVKTKNFDMWTDAPSVWIADDTWQTNTHGITDKDLEDQECYAAVYNPPEAINVCAFYFPNIKNAHVFKCFSWIPEENVNNNQETVDYQLWIDEGWLNKVSGVRVTGSEVADEILSIINDKKYFVKAIGFGNNETQWIAPELEAGGNVIVAIPQVFSKLSQQTKEFEALAKSGQIEHFGNPIFRHHIRNTVIKSNANGEIAPDRKGSGTKIGFVVAALNAMVVKFEQEKEGTMTSFEFQSL